MRIGPLELLVSIALTVLLGFGASLVVRVVRMTRLGYWLRRLLKVLRAIR